MNEAGEGAREDEAGAGTGAEPRAEHDEARGTPANDAGERALELCVGDGDETDGSGSCMPYEPKASPPPPWEEALLAAGLAALQSIRESSGGGGGRRGVVAARNESPP